jgi:hypothetical protein
MAGFGAGRDGWRMFPSDVRSVVVAFRLRNPKGSEAMEEVL